MQFTHESLCENVILVRQIKERSEWERESCIGKYNMPIRRVFRFSIPDDLSLARVMDK